MRTGQGKEQPMLVRSKWAWAPQSPGWNHVGRPMQKKSKDATVTMNYRESLIKCKIKKYNIMILKTWDTLP